ncbi:MAG: hypothetical protein DRI65_13355 [Chloroflexota bacterium]|nr:MAG: hypothetical protein DRI65_13355 [Chloroflexota bacterium]
MKVNPMKPRSLLSQTLRIFAVVVVIILVIVAIIAGIGWLAGWQSEEKFKTAIQIAGLVLIGVGFLGIKGNRDTTRGFEYQDSMSVTKDDSWKRTQQSLRDFAQSYSFLLIMFASGGLCLIIGMLM